MGGIQGFIASLGGRKFVAAILGVVAVLLTTKFGYELSEGLQTKIIESIGWIVGGYTVGQGVADGLSGGKTSSTAIANGATVEKK